MRDLTLTLAARSARNAATIALADQGGASNSAIRLYTELAGTLLAVRQLAKPCGAVRSEDGRISLVASSVNDLVAATGVATWAEWVSGDGTLLAAGPVTDEDGNISDGVGGTLPSGDIGPWVLAGTSGTQLYEGGLVLLAVGLIG